MRALAFALALLAQPLAAETRQHGNVLFDIPDGFGYGKIGPTGTLSVWADHDLDACPACEVLIGAGAVAEGPVDAFLAANTRRLIDPWDSPTVEPVEGIGTFLLQNRYPAAFQQQWVGERFQILFAIAVGDRMELVAFETPFIDQATMDRAMQTYDGPIRRMIDGLSFVSDGARPLIGAPEPGALYGVWWNARYWSTVNWDGTMTTHNQHRWLTFYPDGRFYDGTPPAGTAPLDPARLYAEGDMGWGNYRLDGSDLTLSFASGAVEALQFDGTTLKTEYLTLNPVQLYADGIAVEGRVDSFSYVAFGAISGMTGGTTSASEAIFRPDGTWTGTDASATGGMLDAGGGFASDRSTTVSGRYEVKNGLLLTYDDQGRLYGSEYLFQDKDGTIWVGTETLD